MLSVAFYFGQYVLKDIAIFDLINYKTEERYHLSPAIMYFIVGRMISTKFSGRGLVTSPSNLCLPRTFTIECLPARPRHHWCQIFQPRYFSGEYELQLYRDALKFI